LQVSRDDLAGELARQIEHDGRRERVGFSTTSLEVGFDERLDVGG